MITIKSEKKSYGINFPTSLNELTPEILNEITKQVKLPKHYCIVALCFKTRVFDFVVAMNSKKEQAVAIVPLLAKINEEDKADVNAEVSDRVVLSRSALEMGTHISLPVIISTDNARRYFSSDEELTKSIITRRNSIFTDMTKKDNIIVLEFKIIPVSDIKATVPADGKGLDPFCYTNETSN